MRGRLPLVVLLGSALVFLVSLYLPWRSGSRGVLQGIDGWSADASYVAALVALAVVWAAVAGLLRPGLAARLPLGGLGVALAYFAYAAAAQIHSSVQVRESGAVAYGSWAYGAYLGIGAATLAGLAALALRREELLRRRPAPDVAAVLLGLGLVVSFLLTWETFAGFDLSRIGVDSPPAPIAAAWLIVGAGRWLAGAPRLRLVVAVIAAVLTGGAATGSQLPAGYAQWVGIGCAVALVVLEAARARPPLGLVRAPGRWSALRAAGALLLLVALFLPWMEYGPPHHVFTTHGWDTSFGAVAGALALGLLARPVLTWLAAYAFEMVLGVALLVTTFGVISSTDYPAFRMGYGAYLGFAAGALLVVGTFAPLRWSPVDRRRALVHAVPILASLACVAEVVLPVWQGVLPQAWALQAEPVIGWFWAVALLLTVHLLCRWVAQVRHPSASLGLVLTPLYVVPLPTLRLANERSGAVTWGGVILIGLCLLLAVLGWFESTGGLEKVGIPEVFRVDRLPGAET